LDGFSVNIDVQNKSGSLDSVQIAYKGGAPTTLDTRVFIDRVFNHKF
jgi:hypothetical protein